MIGPFDNTENRGRTTPYPPETEINLSATYPPLPPTPYPSKGGEGKAGEVKWRKADEGLWRGHLDFNQLFTPTEWGVAYAIIEVVSPDDRKAHLRLGSDDGVKVWLNGAVVWTNQVSRGLMRDEDVVPIPLKGGANRLLFKVDQGVGAWELVVRITDTEGQPIEGLRFRSTEK